MIGKQALKIICVALGMTMAGLSADAYVKSDSDLCEPIKGDVESIARFFEDVAFGHAPNASKLMKWTTPVRMKLVRTGRKSDAVIADLAIPLIGRFNAVEASPTIGLDVKLAELDPKKPKPNGWVIFADSINHYALIVRDLTAYPEGHFFRLLGDVIKSDLETDREGMENGTGCRYAYDVGRRDEILQAIMVLPGFGKYTTTCATRTTLHVLGLLNPSSEPAPSILKEDFEQAHANRNLADEQFDLMMLRVLYDAQIKPGMERDKAGALIRRIIRKACPHLS